MKARVFSAYIKDVDKKPAPTVWGEKPTFGTIYGEFTTPAGGWVHTVSFSPSGNVLAFAGHDSTISVVYPGSGPTIHTVRMSTLPLVTLIWASEDSVVAAGHDCQPYVFSGNEGGWKLIGSLDDTSAPKSTLTPSKFSPGGPGRLNSAAFNTFKNADSRGISRIGSTGNTQEESELLTVHQNTITSVRPYEGQSGAVTRVSTTGVDGKLAIWNVGSVTALTAKLGSAYLR